MSRKMRSIVLDRNECFEIDGVSKCVWDGPWLSPSHGEVSRVRSKFHSEEFSQYSMTSDCREIDAASLLRPGLAELALHSPKNKTMLGCRSC